jgi:hypothetical protein
VGIVLSLANIVEFRNFLYSLFLLNVENGQI